MFIQTNRDQRLYTAFLQMVFRVVQVSGMSKKYHPFPEAPTICGADGLDFYATGEKNQRYGSSLIAAGVTGGKPSGLKTPNSSQMARYP